MSSSQNLKKKDAPFEAEDALAPLSGLAIAGFWWALIIFAMKADPFRVLIAPENPTEVYAAFWGLIAHLAALGAVFLMFILRHIDRPRTLKARK